MKRSSTQLRDDARAIWQAGVTAVDSQRLVEANIQFQGDSLRIVDQQIPFDGERRKIAVVGAGKAGAAMAAGAEHALQEVLDRVTGWVNVPADCVRPLNRISLHAARPAGVNEPTEAGVAGSREILRIVQQLDEEDLCICLISGGGSALLPLPKNSVSLADKQALTRHLSAAGANIAELNAVRKQLSQIKGGGLARACRAGRLITLIISDVIGDPLDVIASGPTVPDSATAADALEVLEKYAAEKSGASRSIWDLLSRQTQEATANPTCRTSEHVIGNNATAVEACAVEARKRGYRVSAEPAEHLEGDVAGIAQSLADRALKMRDSQLPYDCLITGGEPTVTLAPSSERGRGGRNQQLVAIAMKRLCTQSPASQSPDAQSSAIHVPANVALLSGGTDGEDGPTDAAGAWAADTLGDFDPAALEQAIRRNDAYSFFDSVGGLIKTGPTHTNVCDVRVVVVSR